MIPAPGTIRPEKRVEDVVRQLYRDSLDHVFVTTVGGALLGIDRLGELDGRAAGELVRQRLAAGHG